MLTGPSAVDLSMSQSEERMLGMIILYMFNDKILTEFCCFATLKSHLYAVLVLVSLCLVWYFPMWNFSANVKLPKSL